MKLNLLAPNMTELSLNTGVTILFSYSTPVAATFADGEIVRTEEKYSNTTTRHVNKWLDGRAAKVVSQGYIDGLLGLHDRTIK